MDHVENLLKATLAEIERILNTRTVVGEPITVEGNTIIPLVAVGFGSEAAAGPGKSRRQRVWRVWASAPVAVAASSRWRSSSSARTGVRVEPVRRGAATMVEKVGEAVSRIIEKRGEKTA